MKRFPPIFWFSVAAAALLGALWYRSRQAVAAKSAQADQQRQTIRARNWKLPWEEAITKELPILEQLLSTISSQESLLKKIQENTND